MDIKNNHWIIENNYLQLLVNAEGFWTDIVDKQTNTIWTHAIHEQKQSTGELSISDLYWNKYNIRCELSKSKKKNISKINNAQYDGLNISFSHLTCDEPLITNLEGVSVTTQILLAKNSPDVFFNVISGVWSTERWKFNTIKYPIGFGLTTNIDEGYLVIPHIQGCLIPSKIGDLDFHNPKLSFRRNPLSAVFDVEQMFGSQALYGALSMAWFGAVKERSAYIAIFETPNDASVEIVANYAEKPKGIPISYVTPRWEASNGALNYDRQIHYHFMPDNNYVGLAKYYRAIAKNKGFFKSLKEKTNENPNLKKMIGAPNVKFWILTNKVFPPKIHCLHHSFKQVEEVLDDMFDNLKVKNAMIILAGWMKRGYDNLHPDIFPPSAEAGGEIGLKAFFNNANEKGYLAGVHDNYQDIYPDSSAFKSKPYMKHEDGSPKAGGQWDGGQAYLLCSSEAIHYVKRNISELLSKYSNTVVFIDCTASDQFFECYDSKHPLTRTQDRENRVAIINAVTDKGLLAGSETGMECFVPFMHYFEGMVGSSFGVPVPLFNLVFHDAVISYWHQREPYNRSPKDYVQNFLLDLLYGNPPIWVFKCDSTYWQHKDKFKESYEIVARFHKSVAYDELLEHKWLELGRFRDVQQTTFTSNVEVTINLGRTMYRSPRGWQLQPNGFHVESTLGTMTGVVS